MLSNFRDSIRSARYFTVTLRSFRTDVNRLSVRAQRLEERNESHFLYISNKKVDVYKDTGLKERLFIFLPVLQRASWRGVHSTAIHLCATGFIYTSQTFIKANLMAKKREKERGKNAYENAAAVRGQYSQNKKTTYKKYLTIIYT